MSTLRNTALAASAVILMLASGCASADSSGTPIAADCTPEWIFSTLDEGKLIVAGVGALPYVDVEPGSTDASGIDGQLLSRFAEEACLTAEFRSLGGPAATAAMTEGQADVAAGGWFATPERGEILGQTDPVWYSYNAIISADGLETIEELHDKKVGVVAGSIYVAPLEATVGAANVSQYQTIDGVFQDIAAGRIDAAIGTSAELAFQNEQRGADLKVVDLSADPAAPELTSVGLANFPHTKGNTELTDALNEYIATIRSDGFLADVLAGYGIAASAITEQ